MTVTDWIQAISTVILVMVTGVYAWLTLSISKGTKKQAEASVKMAEEMRAQTIAASRPWIIQRAVPGPRPGETSSMTIVRTKEPLSSDKFEIHNSGNGPAIDLEILLLDKDKGHPQIERRTFLGASDPPVHFSPQNLGACANSRCYLMCQYEGTSPHDAKRVVYQTWLPFVPVVSQNGAYIYVEPQPLEFYERTKRESY